MVAVIGSGGLVILMLHVRVLPAVLSSDLGLYRDVFAFVPAEGAAPPHGIVAA